MAGPELTALINGNYSSEGKNKAQWAHVPFRTVDEDWLALALATNTGLPVIIVTELKLIFEVFQK